MVDVLAATGLLLCVVAVCSPLHRSVRRLCNPTITTWTIQQLPLVAAAQFYSNRLLDVAVLLSAATITLEVYLTLIPVLIWSGKAHEVIAGLLPQLALSGYVVFAIKDLLVGVLAAAWWGWVAAGRLRRVFSFSCVSHPFHGAYTPVHRIQ